MKVMTIFGTRPEIIRLTRVIRELDAVSEQILVHTGQNYEPRLSELFLRELDVRAPDEFLGIESADFAAQIGQILARISPLFERHRPDRVLILGDTNSGLCAFVAARRGIPVYHMEAGNRCYDDRVPEEINRRIIDHSSTVLMPYTHRSKENLLREGFARHRIFVTGNPIFEVLNAFSDQIDASEALPRMGLISHGYFLATLHRAENVDAPRRLASFMQGLSAVADRFGKPVVVSVHPRTSDKLRRSGLAPPPETVRMIEPVGFFDFVKLERHAAAVLTDSGTVQEECCIFGVPSVTLRDVTERPETVECGSSRLVGCDPATIVEGLASVMDGGVPWNPPVEYLEPRVARTVRNVVLGVHAGMP